MNHPYASKIYANAFLPEYQPVYLATAKTHILKRKIPGTEYFDAIGVYPLCPIAENADLEKDFLDLKKDGIISLVLVADPFFQPQLEKLQKFFSSVSPYKEHYLHDFSLNNNYSKHHRYEIKKAVKLCETRRLVLVDHLDEWYMLYRNLMEKHEITGIQGFSRNYFSKICALDPITFGAFSEGTLISAHIWFEYNGYIYSHLAASSEIGYQTSASYAVYAASLKYFAESGAKTLDLGAGAGASKASKGLSFLKKGFSNTSKTCYLCCKILDEEKYMKLSAGKNINYFPAYRR